MGYIYKIVNTINGKIYVGQTTKSIEERWQQHKIKAKQHPNRYLYDAMNHYGVENFKIESIEECENSLLNEREQYWIRYLHSYYLDDNSNGYNMTLGGDGGNTWEINPHKEQTGEKISKALLGHSVSQETREKLSKAKKGIHEIEINKDQLLSWVQQGKSIQEISSYYHASEWTIRSRCKEWFGCSYGQLRKQPVERKPRLLSEEGRKSLIEANKLRIGKNNPAYKDLPVDEFYNDIINGMSADDLSKKYNISKPTICKKCKEYFNKPLRELRKEKNVKQSRNQGIIIFNLCRFNRAHYRVR